MDTYVNQKSSNKLVFKTALWLLGISLVALMIHFAGWENILASVRSVHPTFLLLLCILQVGTLALSTYQLYYLMKCSGAALPFMKVFSIYMTGHLVENITPSLKFGGEAVKVYLLKKHTRSNYKQIAGVFLVYKLVSLLPFLVILLVSASLVYWRLDIHAWIYAGVLAFSVLMVGALCIGFKKMGKRMPKPIAKIGNFLGQAAHHARQVLNKKQFVQMMAISCFIWLAYPLKLYMIAMLLGIQVPFIILAPILYVGYMISMLPLAPGGLGSFEGSMVLMLSRTAVSVPDAWAAVLLLRFITYWFSLFLSTLFAALLLLGTRKQTFQTWPVARQTWDRK